MSHSERTTATPKLDPAAEPPPLGCGIVLVIIGAGLVSAWWFYSGGFLAFVGFLFLLLGLVMTIAKLQETRKERLRITSGVIGQEKAEERNHYFDSSAVKLPSDSKRSQEGHRGLYQGQSESSEANERTASKVTGQVLLTSADKTVDTSDSESSDILVCGRCRKATLVTEDEERYWCSWCNDWALGPISIVATAYANCRRCGKKFQYDAARWYPKVKAYCDECDAYYSHRIDQEFRKF